MYKKIVSVFLALIMVVAATYVVTAGSNSRDVELGGGYIVTYEAYCYDAYGGASTSIYAPYVYESYVDASVTLYAYNEDTNHSICAGSAYSSDDWYADAVVDNVAYPDYVGDHVITEHSVYVDDLTEIYSDSDTWFAVN